MKAYADIPDRVLAVFAHPDDADIACGGTLARLSSEGSLVTLIVVALGEKGSSDAAGTPEGLAVIRRKEVLEASAFLGIGETLFMEIPDGEVQNDRMLRERLVREVRRVRPSLVIAPDPTAVFFGENYVNHADHRELGWAVLDAVFPASRLPRYFPETGPPHAVGTVLLAGTLDPNRVVDIVGFIDAKVASVLAHRSQVGEGSAHVSSVITHRARETGSLFGLDLAESFRAISSA